MGGACGPIAEPQVNFFRSLSSEPLPSAEEYCLPAHIALGQDNLLAQNPEDIWEPTGFN
jgi:hypothetical protein